jgi:uncharacterized Zn finger protein (UPF0148 family)
MSLLHEQTSCDMCGDETMDYDDDTFCGPCENTYLAEEAASQAERKRECAAEATKLNAGLWERNPEARHEPVGYYAKKDELGHWYVAYTVG